MTTNKMTFRGRHKHGSIRKKPQPGRIGLWTSYKMGPGTPLEATSQLKIHLGEDQGAGAPDEMEVWLSDDAAEQLLRSLLERKGRIAACKLYEDTYGELPRDSTAQQRAERCAVLLRWQHNASVRAGVIWLGSILAGRHGLRGEDAGEVLQVVDAKVGLDGWERQAEPLHLTEAADGGPIRDRTVQIVHREMQPSDSIVLKRGGAIVAHACVGRGGMSWEVRLLDPGARVWRSCRIGPNMGFNPADKTMGEARRWAEVQLATRKSPDRVD